MPYQTVKGFYADKNIFLTGGSGFVGVSYIEKVLRTLPDVGNIYVLLRPRKGQGVQERLETIKSNSVTFYLFLLTVINIYHNCIFIRYLMC